MTLIQAFLLGAVVTFLASATVLLVLVVLDHVRRRREPVLHQDFVERVADRIKERRPLPRFAELEPLRELEGVSWQRRTS